ncbi:MAG: glycerol kinase, partial [Acidimicrobiales bacterium]|nr:glycerol kinase [Acidimicrobiales bacterium]
MSVVVAIDAGTTGVRAIAFDHGGAVVDAAYREFTQHFPRPGWVEHDAAEIWDVTQAVLGALTERLAGREVVAIGITNQRETAVVWDAATSRPLHRALVWQDRRTADRCAALEAAGHLPLVRQRTGLVLDPYFTGSKLGWLFSDGGVPTGPTTRAGTVDSWLVWNLTGGAAHVTDTSNASRTLLFDIGRLAWDDELCALFDVPSHVLPEVRPSSARYGVTTADVAGVGAGVPVSGIAGDQQAALFGQACFEPGMTKNTYGTGSFVLMNVGETCPPPIDGLLTTVAWSLPDADAAMRTTYALEGSIFVTGAAVQWLRDGLGIIASAADLEPLAAEVDSTDGVVLVPAFTGLGSPEWDPYARGTIVG